VPHLLDHSKDHIVQAYGIKLLGAKNKLLKELNKNYAPSVHGDQNWLSSFLLIDYLLHKRLLSQRKRVLELGCGWGAASIFCSSHANCRVTGLDMDDNVFPYLEAQAAINDSTVETRKSSFEKLRTRDLKGYRLVIGTDICFWDELMPTLYKLIRRALKAGVKDIVLADPGRSPFHALAEKCSRTMDMGCMEWYSSEPKRFEGYILHIRNS
jgi:predicted nicotinamide N-methyase